jgi:hypothetical protein
MVRIPFRFMTAIDAVNRKTSRVRIPRYMIRGLPKIRKYEISWNMTHPSTRTVPCISGWIVQEKLYDPGRLNGRLEADWLEPRR